VIEGLEEGASDRETEPVSRRSSRITSAWGGATLAGSIETLALLNEAAPAHNTSRGCLSLLCGVDRVNEELVAQSSKTLVTWCDPHPEFCARYLDEVSPRARVHASGGRAKLQPAGAIYFLMDEADVTR